MLSHRTLSSPVKRKAFRERTTPVVPAAVLQIRTAGCSEAGIGFSKGGRMRWDRRRGGRAAGLITASEVASFAYWSEQT
jgi:hypothetical protein